MLIRLRGIILLVFMLSQLTGTVQAQSGLSVRLSAPITQNFPEIQSHFSIVDGQSNFVHNLQPDQVVVMEEGNTLPIVDIQELRTGVQVVVAINPGPSFAIRNFQAISRYDLVKDALENWAKSRQGTTLDDWSLLINGGSTASHTSNPVQFLQILESDQVDARTAQPTIDILARAVTLASDPTPHPGMGREVLFITSTLDGNIEQPLKDITDQARQQGITIHLWLVASSGALVTQSVQKLIEMANATGGQTFTYSGEEPLPDPEDYLEGKRYIYQFTYQSKVGLSGEHIFSIQVQYGDEQVQSNQQRFQINLQPPEPAFVSPPISIERKLNDQAGGAKDIALPEGKTSMDFLSPREITLQAVYDFPDGQKRDLVNSALLVDGIVATENQAPPFDKFIWNLDPYLDSGNHQLQIQVTDVLGLTGTSIEMPVHVSVERPESDPWFVVRRNLVAISVLMALLAGALLFLVLVLAGQLRPMAQKAASQKRRGKKPVALPQVKSESPGHKLPGWVSRFQHPHQSDTPDAVALLNPVVEDGEGALPIPITSGDVLLGSDPNQVDLVLNDPCIEAVHARLTQEPDGNFTLIDQGSIAGTWINYAPVDQKGTRLQHGDLVHFGRLGFHFSSRQPIQILRPSVVPDPQQLAVSEEPEQEREELAP
jgi:hypothetical protein